MDPYLEVFLFLAWLGALAFSLYLMLEKSVVSGLILTGAVLVIPLGELNKRWKEAKAAQPQATHVCACTCTPNNPESGPESGSP